MCQAYEAEYRACSYSESISGYCLRCNLPRSKLVPEKYVGMFSKQVQDHAIKKSLGRIL